MTARRGSGSWGAVVALLALVGVAVAACQSGGGSGTAPSPAPATSDPAGSPSPTASASGAGGEEEAGEEWDWDDDASTLDGVYTQAQAQRGLEVFERVCADCHETVDWTDELFLQRWHGESLYRFWFYIYERMPNGEPPYTLPRQDVTDVATYILQLNGLPAGERELGSDDDSLTRYWLYWWATEAEDVGVGAGG